VTITFPEVTDPHGVIYFHRSQTLKKNKHAIRLLVSIYMTVEQPGFERVCSMSEHQIFPARFKLQYLYIYIYIYMFYSLFYSHRYLRIYFY
jgi:hypothetical protein